MEVCVLLNYYFAEIFNKFTNTHYMSTLVSQGTPTETNFKLIESLRNILRQLNLLSLFPKRTFTWLRY